MTFYRVVYEIDIEAVSPEVAAREVWRIFRDPESCPPIFDVIPWGGAELNPPSVLDYPNTIQIDCENVEI